MAKNKTENTNEDVIAFINAVESEQKRKDSHSLIALMSEISGEQPKMFGPTIVGFGNYHYKYESGHEGTAPLLGFSPRKAAFSLYVFTGLEEHAHLLNGLGKFTMGKACIYVKKLSDIDEGTLIRLMEASIEYITQKYTRINS
jgi:hypothetical protein